LNAKLLEIAQTKVAMYDAYISEMEQTPDDEAYLRGTAAHSVRVPSAWSPRETTVSPPGA